MVCQGLGRHSAEENASKLRPVRAHRKGPAQCYARPFRGTEVGGEERVREERGVAVVATLAPFWQAFGATAMAGLEDER
jgi:hypothetical protein